MRHLAPALLLPAGIATMANADPIHPGWPLVAGWVLLLAGCAFVCRLILDEAA